MYSPWIQQYIVREFVEWSDGDPCRIAVGFALMVVMMAGIGLLVRYLDKTQGDSEEKSDDFHEKH